MNIGSFFSGIAHDITDSFGLTAFGNGPTSKFWDQLKNGRTNDVNKEVADQNLAFQRENLDYQKALQQKIFEREDSAYQRTVADMRQAGLSPLMMNGTNGAGEAIQTQALNNSYQHQDKGNLDAILGIGNFASSLYSNYQKAQRDKAEINNINAQTESTTTTNAFLPFSLAASLVGQILQNKSTSKTIQNQTADYGLKMLQTLEQSYKNADLKRWNEYGSMFGISSNMSEKERYAQFAKYLLDNVSGSDSAKESAKDLFPVPNDDSDNSFLGNIKNWLKNNSVKGTPNR